MSDSGFVSQGESSEIDELRGLLADQRVLLEQLGTQLDSLSSAQARIACAVDNYQGDVSATRWAAEFLRLAATRTVSDEVYEFCADRQLDLLGTLEHLTQSEDSLARYGDGELRMLLKPEYSVSFQKNSPGVMGRLKEVLSSPREGLIVGLPHCYRDRFWTALWLEVWGPMQRYLPRSQMYANSHVTRPLVFQFLGDRAVELWRDVWRDRDVRVIAGKGSRFELVPELFGSARSIDRIDSLAVNAFEDIPRLMEPSVLGHPDMFVIALGPAGTVLAHDLHVRGFRALDIGHLSASFRHVFDSGTVPEGLPTVVGGQN